MPTKTVTKKKATKKTPAKKKVAPKKTATKKLVTKKKVVAKKSRPADSKVITKKKAASKTRKTAPHTNETVTKKKANEKTKKLLNKLVELPTEDNLPPVEEKSPVVNNPNIVAPGREKSIQRAAVRNYVKKQIRLSSKKGGTKPAGKKPLW